jgi:NADH-quinone oxidoreductase subunit G
MFIGHRNGQVFRYRPRVNPEVNDHWLCDYGRFSHERYDTDRVVVPKTRRDDYLGIATWTEALEAIEEAFRSAGPGNVAVIASANMTNEDAYVAKKLFAGSAGVKSIGVMVDPIGPIKMKSRNEWLIGTQGAPNFRGVEAILGSSSLDVEKLMTQGAEGIDVLYICDAEFSERAKDPAVAANLRKARFLIVHSWDASHPLNDVADVLLPGTIHAEKEGTFTNLQGRVQRIHQAFAPKGQAATDLEIFRRIGARLFPDSAEYRSVDALDIFETLRATVPAMQNALLSDDAGAPAEAY